MMPSSTSVADPEPPLSRARRRRCQRRRKGGPTLGGSNASESIADSIEDSSSLEDPNEHIIRSKTDMSLGGDSSSPFRGYKICVN